VSETMRGRRGRFRLPDPGRAGPPGREGGRLEARGTSLRASRTVLIAAAVAMLGLFAFGSRAEAAKIRKGPAD
jgi:hypothetical protein